MKTRAHRGRVSGRGLTAFCLLVAAVITIGLTLAGVLQISRSPVAHVASQK
jgi:hypothetical protein